MAELGIINEQGQDNIFPKLSAEDEKLFQKGDYGKDPALIIEQQEKTQQKLGDFHI